MVKQIVLKTIFCSIIISPLMAPVSATTITLNPDPPNSSVKYFDTNTGVWVYTIGNYHLGRDDGSMTGNSNEDTYRTGYEFDISQIPDNARINSATLRGNIQGVFGYSYQGKLVGIPYNVFLGDPEALWNAVGNSSMIYLDNIEYNQNFSGESDDLKDVISGNLSADVFKVGLMCLDENQNESVGYLNNFQIRVDYSVLIEVTITTNPEGIQFSVDGQTYTSAQTFNWYSGDEHTIATTTPQTFNGKTYGFQNWSDGGGIEHVITPESNQTITANFVEVLDIIVKNRHDGGFVKVDNVQHASGDTFYFAQGSIHDFEASEQNYGGYDMVFKPNKPNWDTPDGPFYTALIDNHAVQNSGTYTAQLWRIGNFNADMNFLNCIP